MMINYLAPPPLQNDGSADAVDDMYTMQFQQPQSATSSSSSSHLPPPQQQSRASSPLSSSNSTSEDQSPSSSATFPMKLHSMLTDSESLGFDDVVCWMGKQAFKVVDPHRFALDVMPMYFNQTKYKSFQRQLNIYNFQKVHYGPLKGGYTHKFLVKGHPHLCEEIKRESSSRHAAAVAASAVAVPSLKQVVTFESTRGHNDSSAILSMPTRTWAIQQQGEGDFVRAPAAARSSCSNSTSSQLFDTTVDEIAAFATSIIGNNRANNELSYDATPLPFQPEPQASSSSMSMMGTPNSTGVRRGSSTVPNILDKEDIAYFKNLFQPGDVSQEKEIMETFFLDGTNNQQKPQLSASTVAPPLAPSMPQQHHRQQPVMMPPPPAFRQQHQAAVAPAAALPPQQQPTPVMSYTVQPFAPRDVAPPATTTGVSPLMASAAVSEYNFPRKLYRLLQDCDTNPEYQSICSWLADGKQFKIHNKKRFVDTILPHYFDQTQYASFRRQLNMYSFVRQSMSTYANPYFVRGRHELLDHVVRKCCCRSSSKKG